MKAERDAIASLLIGGGIAVISTLPLFGIGSATPLILLALPGMFLAMGVSDNVHDYSVVLSLLLTWVLYSGGIFGVNRLVRWLRGV